MSAALKILERVNTVHAALWSEAVTFRGREEKARINRIAPKPSGMSGEVAIQAPLGVVILLRKTLPWPRQDEIVTDSEGAQHRLTQDAINLGYAWQCPCDTVQS